MTSRPWQTDEWHHVGRQIRDAWRALRRLSLQAWPERVEWPPRVSVDKAQRTSHPQRAVERLEEREEKLGLRRQDVNDAIAELSDVDHEAFLALARHEGLGKGEKRMQAAEIAQRHSCSEARIYGLLRDGWAFVAWRISREG